MTPMARVRTPLIPVALAFGILLLVAIAGVFVFITPIFKLPAPTGLYPVGTRTLYLVDSSRGNSLDADHEAAGRDIVVQLWYPAVASNNKRAPYRMAAESTLRTRYMSLVPTYSRQDAPLAADASPWHVLLFNPAWGSRRGQSTGLMEDLASHGYVVAAIEHPGRTGPISLPDGRLLPVVPDPDVDDEAHSTVERIEAALAREVDKEAADDSFVLDKLALLDQERGSPYYQRLDTQHAGVLGHSLGGSVAADACALDPRLLSAFSMSGPFFGKVLTVGLHKPYLNMTEEVNLRTPEQLAQLDYADRIDGETDLIDAANFDRLLREDGGYRVTVLGINHSSFTDKAFYSPLRRLSGEGHTPRKRVLLIVRAYAEQFFGSTLRGEPAPLLHPSVTAPFPEVVQEYFPGTESEKH
jgi:dienelactone hydrolase